MLYEISCNIGSRYNGIPLYTYLTYKLCIMAVILQTRCFQMDNCKPDLSFSKYVELHCFRWLYIYGHICDFLSRYSFTKWTAWGLAPNEDNRTPGTGRLKRLEHCELMNTYRSWWRHKTSIFGSFRFYLRKGGGGRFKLILAINTLSIFCEIPIRWIQHLTGH